MLTRLSENTTDDLDELAELIEDSWRALRPQAGARATHEETNDDPPRP